MKMRGCINNRLINISKTKNTYVSRGLFGNYWSITCVGTTTGTTVPLNKLSTVSKRICERKKDAEKKTVIEK